jgi:hypothetical protein
MIHHLQHLGRVSALELDSEKARAEQAGPHYAKYELRARNKTTWLASVFVTQAGSVWRSSPLLSKRLPQNRSRAPSKG